MCIRDRGVDAKESADHAAKGGMLGISKESWMAALEKENYLTAAEMSMEDDYGMIDGIINNGPKEDKTAEVKAPETGEKSSIMDRLKSAKAEKLAADAADGPALIDTAHDHQHNACAHDQNSTG